MTTREKALVINAFSVYVRLAFSVAGLPSDECYRRIRAFAATEGLTILDLQIANRETQDLVERVLALLESVEQ